MKPKKYNRQAIIRAIADSARTMSRGIGAHTMERNSAINAYSRICSTMVLSGTNNNGIMLSLSTLLRQPHVLNSLTPLTRDWRARGAVTGVKNQGIIETGWTFAATGAIEGAHYISTTHLISLSEQQILDCSHASHNLPTDAFQYIIDCRGSASEAAYPYTGTIGGLCHFDQSHVSATISRYVELTRGDEIDLMNAVGTVGPVAVMIDASTDGFKFYSGGILCDPALYNPSISQSTHGVLVVGYGSESGFDYWLVKNSWSASWGESGYVRLIRGHNMCGIANIGAYPVV
jgi:cathepsin L